MLIEQLRIDIERDPAAQPSELPRLADHGPVPRLDISRERQKHSLTGNVRALLHGPWAPKLSSNPFLRDCAVSGRTSRTPLVISILWHAAVIVLILSLGRLAVAETPAAMQQAELVWYGASRDLPDILPFAPTKPKAPRAPEEPKQDRGSDSFHPRLTIMNQPLHPNHPRQTLIQPDAPLEPPKILPALPNIVEWDAPKKPQINASALALKQAKPRTVTAQQEVAAPELHDGKQLEALNIASPDANIQKPALPVNALAAPRAASVRAAEQAAPEAGAFSNGDSSGQRLIALSAAPAPVAPPSEPLGNLSSRLNISPDAGKSGGAGTGNASGSGGGGSGPPGLSISGGSKRPEGPSGTGSGGSGAGGGTIRPAQPGAPAAGSAAMVPSTSVASRIQPNSFAERIKLGARPESLLGDKRIYSLNVNMPNLTSTSGSWILSFAELDPAEDRGAKSARSGELAGPELLHKVDPKYPSQMRLGHVEGEVLLYAVIRKDGTVDSIQLLSGVDPALDMNTMQALAQWKFRPGARNGEPVDLETIVHIPMHGVAR